jgi:hypothetical protein
MAVAVVEIERAFIDVVTGDAITRVAKHALATERTLVVQTLSVRVAIVQILSALVDVSASDSVTRESYVAVAVE